MIRARRFALSLPIAGALLALAAVPTPAQSIFGTPPWASPSAQAQAAPQPGAAPAQPVSRGENFSDKPAPQLFASDCVGSGCHKGPQGLSKGVGAGRLAGFLREHYTNSRESAAALARYLSGIPSAPEPREARGTRSRPSAKPPRATADREESPSRQARGARASQRGRQTVAAPPIPPEPPAAAPTPEPEPPKKFDIFD